MLCTAQYFAAIAWDSTPRPASLRKPQPISKKILNKVILVGANLNSLSNNTGLLLPCNQVLYRHRVVHSRQPALFKRRYHDDFGNSFSETQRSATPAKIMVRNPRPKVTIYRSNHVYQPVPHPGDQQREFLPEVFSFGSEIRNGFVLRPRRTHRNGARRPETKRSGKSQARGEVAARRSSICPSSSDRDVVEERAIRLQSDWSSRGSRRRVFPPARTSHRCRYWENRGTRDSSTSAQSGSRARHSSGCGAFPGQTAGCRVRYRVSPDVTAIRFSLCDSLRVLRKVPNPQVRFPRHQSSLRDGGSRQAIGQTI